MKRLGLLILLLASPAGADVATFQQNVNSYTGALDVTLRSGASASTNFENSGELNMKSANPDFSDFTRASLLSFDLSSLSAANTVTSVTLALTSLGAGNGTIEVRIFKLLRTDWVAAQATWNIYKTGSNWTTAGARSDGNDMDGDWTDGAPGEISSFQVTGADVSGTVKTWPTTTAFVALVQASLGGTLNLDGQMTFQANVNCSMRDSSDSTASNRPLLTITYTAAGGGAAPSPVTAGVVIRSAMINSAIIR